MTRRLVCACGCVFEEASGELLLAAVEGHLAGCPELARSRPGAGLDRHQAFGKVAATPLGEHRSPAVRDRLTVRGKDAR